MSGFLGALLGGSNQERSGQSTAIADVLQQVLSQNGGGVATLISRFTDAGLGDHVQSWVSGKQQPITPDHVDRVFTAEKISSGKITGWPSGKMVRLSFSRHIPEPVRQQIRNWWAVNGWPAPHRQTRKERTP